MYGQMPDYSYDEKLIIVQHAIKKFENETIVIEKLKSIFSEANHRHANRNSKGTTYWT